MGRRTVEACRAIDVRELQRTGCLGRDGLHTLRWLRDEQQEVGSVGLQISTDGVVLLYRVKIDGDDWEDISELVPIVRVGCHLGGARPFFLCPGVVNGVPCGRRVALLYLADRYFLCRSCARLAYRSQHEDAWDRAVRRVDKLHQRLGIQRGHEQNAPNRPAGMWKRTFATLLEKADEAQAEADAIFVDRLRHLMRPNHVRHRRKDFWA